MHQPLPLEGDLCGGGVGRRLRPHDEAGRAGPRRCEPCPARAPAALSGNHHRAARGGHFTRGCLIGDFSLETAQASELLRQRLAEIFADWLKPFAACIAAAQQAGTIPARFAPDDLAEFLLASWQGANASHEGRAQPRSARPLPPHRLRNNLPGDAA
ncbi:TetR family transcriptional regulator C-terminal domain-containing protein [Bosea thiooxidans]